jgi:hypothetical protein
LLGAGQTPFLQAAFRHGLAGPLLDRASTSVLSAAQLEEPLVEDAAADILAWLLHQEGDRRVISGPSEGLQVLFNPLNAGHGWVRLFRIDVPVKSAFQGKIRQRLQNLARYLESEPDETIYGMLGLPVGPALEQDAILEHLEGTRWSSGHWMAACYLPERGGFGILGVGHDVLALPGDGRPVVPEGSELAAALEEEEDLDLLPGLSHRRQMGAFWGGQAFVEAVSLALRDSVRLDIQWAPVPLDEVAKPLRQVQSCPFGGVDFGEMAEVGVLGVVLPTPATRILIAFEPVPDPDFVGLGLLDEAAQKVLQENFGAVRKDGALVLRKAKVGALLMKGLPIWNRLFRIGLRG